MLHLARREPGERLVEDHGARLCDAGRCQLGELLDAVGNVGDTRLAQSPRADERERLDASVRIRRVSRRALGSAGQTGARAAMRGTRL